MSIEKFEQILSLITEDRLRESTAGRRGLLIASESDKGRVINSAPFRRLQQKAQVFPLESNAAVRTRLTHSIEVSQVGRHVAQKVIEKAGGNSFGYSQLAAFVNTVETACLLHDIGNPPFGHLGESAIKEWFSDFSENAESIPDLVDFDGNPQGFRLMSFLAGADCHGFNLTCSLLLTTLKYPWGLAGRPEGKKIGLFDGDLESYREACGKVGWEPGKSFPLMKLMDTADEIAYSMSDIEDGLEKDILSEDDLRGEFGADHFNSAVIKPFVSFKTKIINMAADEAASRFVDNLDLILEGGEINLISDASEAGEILKRVKKLAREKIYTDKAAESVELAGRSVIKGLLNHFGELLKLPEDKFVLWANGDARSIRDSGLDFQARLFRRLPKGYREKYNYTARGREIERRAHLIVDFISGMTDDFALETYQILEGIRIK